LQEKALADAAGAFCCFAGVFEGGFGKQVFFGPVFVVKVVVDSW
jgi:hypothetical protein